MCPGGVVAAKAKTTSRSYFRSAFDVLDADHDGKISREDLRMFYGGFSSGGPDDNDVIESMMSLADFNEDGFVEYDEFERVLDGKKKRKSSNGLMEDVFKVMDKDGDGKLSHGDLKSYMQWVGFDASDDDIKAMIKLAGGDEKVGVSYDDLLKILAVDYVL